MRRPTRQQVEDVVGLICLVFVILVVVIFLPGYEGVPLP